MEKIKQKIYQEINFLCNIIIIHFVINSILLIFLRIMFEGALITNQSQHIPSMLWCIVQIALCIVGIIFSLKFVMNTIRASLHKIYNIMYIVYHKIHDER